MFIFCNKARNTLKILVWDSGYLVLTKRLKKGTFAWPSNDDEAISITKNDIKRIIKVKMYSEDYTKTIQVDRRM